MLEDMRDKACDRVSSWSVLGHLDVSVSVFIFLLSIFMRAFYSTWSTQEAFRGERGECWHKSRLWRKKKYKTHVYGLRFKHWAITLNKQRSRVAVTDDCAGRGWRGHLACVCWRGGCRLWRLLRLLTFRRRAGPAIRLSSRLKHNVPLRHRVPSFGISPRAP